MEHRIEELLVKYVRHELGRAQTELVEDWISESEEHKKMALKYFRMEQYARSLGRMENEDPERILAMADGNVRTGHVRPRALKRAALRYAFAACFAVIVAMGIQFFHAVEQKSALTREYISEAADFSPVVLEDGTNVWLNNNSRLLVPEHFRKHSRTVRLEGQAFFEVSPDAKRPFTVTTSKGDVKVLGTSFDVVAYPDAASEFSATLVTGKVQVNVLSSGVRRSATMLPGQRFTFSPETQEAHLAEVDVESLTSWKTGRIVANHTPLKDVLSIISNTYGVRFVINAPEKLKDTCTGIFERQDVEQILMTIEKVTGVNFSMAGDSSDGVCRYIVY